MALSNFFRFRSFLEGSTGAGGGFSALGLLKTKSNKIPHFDFCFHLISTLAIAFSKGAVVAAAELFFFFFALVLEAVGTNGSEDAGARPGMEEEEEVEEAGARPGM